MSTLFLSNSASAPHTPQPPGSYPQSPSVHTNTTSSQPGTPMSGISTVAMKDGHEGNRHSTHTGEYVASSGDRLARLGGFGIDRGYGNGNSSGASSNARKEEGLGYFDRVSGWRKNIETPSEDAAAAATTTSSREETPVASSSCSSSRSSTSNSGSNETEDSTKTKTRTSMDQSCAGNENAKGNGSGNARNLSPPLQLGQIPPPLPPPPVPTQKRPTTSDTNPPPPATPNLPPNPPPNTPLVFPPQTAAAAASPSTLLSFPLPNHPRTSTLGIHHHHHHHHPTTTPYNSTSHSNSTSNTSTLSTTPTSFSSSATSTPANGIPASPASTITTSSVRHEKERAKMISGVTHDEGVVDTTMGGVGVCGIDGEREEEDADSRKVTGQDEDEEGMYQWN